MLLTVLFGAFLGIVAFGLVAPFDVRRLLVAALAGAILGAIAAYFNVYPGSIRGALGLLVVAMFVSGARFGGRFAEPRPPLVPRLPLVAALLALLLLGAGLYPYTAAGAKSVDEPLYQDLNNNQIQGPAPALTSAGDVRVVPWDLASQLVVRGYGDDASFLDTTEALLLRNTYPDTVRGEFIWVHAPTPETSKWLFGSRTADQVVYVRNNATDLEPKVISGTLSVHTDGRFWQDRLQRYALNEGEMRYILEDVALQLDDERVPHWIAYLARLDLRNQPHLEKLVVVNAYSGEEAVYGLDEVPAWIEMVYPEKYVYYWASYWGAQREGIMYRWFDAAKLVEPDDVTVRYILLEGKNYWLLPMRQLNSPQLGGYVLVNTRTGDASYYDRADDSLVDYDTALTQVYALQRSGEAARQLTNARTDQSAQLNLLVDEGYLYPISMADGNVRDAWVFPLLEGRNIRAFAIIDAQHFTNQSVFGKTIAEAVARYSGKSFGAPPVTPPGEEAPAAQTLRVEEGVVADERILVRLNGTYYRVTTNDLAEGERREADREWDELTLAIARAQRGDDVSVAVRFDGGRVVDVTLPGVAWG